MSDEDARAILKRRARYVAMALAGVGTATQAACGPCLSPSVDAGDPHADASIDAAPPLDVGDPAPDAVADEDAPEDAR